MRCRAFESAASELVDEGAHPVEQLEVLREKARDLEQLGDTDAVIECRIKQLALQRLLLQLHGFPPAGLAEAAVQLAEAYALGGYPKQAQEHLLRARELGLDAGLDAGLDGLEEPQRRRLQLELLVCEAVVHLAEERLDAAQQSLQEALAAGRGHGEMDPRAARVHGMLGRIAQHRGRYAEAIDHLSSAWEVHECLDGPHGEETVRVRLRVAEMEYLAGREDRALETQAQVVESLRRGNALPVLLVDSASQLARWLEARGQDREALAALETAERAVAENFGPEDARAVDVKRDVALLHLKLGSHETALQYLNDVHYLERRLHGSQSMHVARTLKALGTVHLVRRNLAAAEECLLQALRIFEAEHAPGSAIVRDIHAKLASIAALSSTQ